MALTDLTSTLLTNHSNFQVEEWTKQGSEIQFEDGSNQRIVRSTIPAIDMTISYRNVSQSVFESLRSAYEDNYANIVRVNQPESYIDVRDEHSSNNTKTPVWSFQEFKFRVASSTLYTGTISLLSSVFFDFTEYQDLFTQSSSYTPQSSTDTSFTTLLTGNQTPYKIEYTYMNSSIASNIGKSVRHIKDKSLRKKWKLWWLLNESDFLALLVFYRKRGGIMGEFGMPELGYGSTTKTKAVFMKDSFKYEKRIDGMYQCDAEIIEVL